MYLVRKVTRAKWSGGEGLADSEIPADGVTADLRTQRNSLSFWRCPTDAQGELDDLALAIAAGRDFLDKLEFVWLDDDELTADGLGLNDTPGRTPVTELSESHVDVTQLDYMRLGTIARRIHAAIEDNCYRRLTRRSVKNLIADAIEQDRIDTDALSPKLREQVDA